jgi:hypothetical protein
MLSREIIAAALQPSRLRRRYAGASHNGRCTDVRCVHRKLGAEAPDFSQGRKRRLPCVALSLTRWSTNAVLSRE